MEVDLNKLIVPTFRTVASQIITASVSRAILKGGRNTTKSQTTSEAIITGVMQYKASAIAIVKYGNKIEERLVNTFVESLRYMNLEAWWKLRRSPFELVLLDKPYGKETQVSIKFAGAENPDNLKSYKPRAGSFRYIWIEEAADFGSLDDIDNISITMARGVGDHVTILTFNPPRHINHWCNKEYAGKCGRALGFPTDSTYLTREITVGDKKFRSTEVIHHSTYLDVINYHPEWLGNDFLSKVAAYAPAFNHPDYLRTFLGATLQGDTCVFPNVKAWQFKQVEAVTGVVYRGLDMSNGGRDPYRYIQAAYDKKAHALYIWGEYNAPPTMSIKDLAHNIRRYNPNNFQIQTDSAVPTFIRQLQMAGLPAVPVKKRPDSVSAGIAWLQSLTAIYIDVTSAPLTYKEFSEYEYKLTRTGESTGELVDKNNHSIDAVRYACVNIITYG